MKTALHSVSYGGVWMGQAVATLESVIDKAAAFGYDSVMIMAKRPHASLLDMDEAARRSLRSRLDDKGVSLAILAGYNDFCGGTATPDVPYREMQIHYIGELARLAHDLGGDKVRIFTGFEQSQLSYDQQWAWCVQGIREAAQRAADYGVTLCVQNHHDIAVHHESLFDLLTEVDEPNCKAAFDAWAPSLHEVTPDEMSAAIRLMTPLIVHTTVADYVKRPRFKYHPRLINYEAESDVVRAVPMGEGFIDYAAFLKILKDNGYNGYVAYEMCSSLRGGGSEENLDLCARRFLEWMREAGL